MVMTGVMLAGCDNSQANRATRAKKVGDEKRPVEELMEGYYSEDILVAEHCLLKLVDHWSTPPNTNAHAYALGLTHTRLYLLYSQLGRTNDAEIQRGLVLKKCPDRTWDAFLKQVEDLDGTGKVKWKQANK